MVLSFVAGKEHVSDSAEKTRCHFQSFKLNRIQKKREKKFFISQIQQHDAYRRFCVVLLLLLLLLRANVCCCNCNILDEYRPLLERRVQSAT